MREIITTTKLVCGHRVYNVIPFIMEYSPEGAGTLSSTMIICPKCNKRCLHDVIRKKDGTIYFKDYIL